MVIQPPWVQQLSLKAFAAIVWLQIEKVGREGGWIPCLVSTVGLRGDAVGADDSRSDTLCRHWPIWDVGLPEGRLQNSTTDQLSRWIVCWLIAHWHTYAQGFSINRHLCHLVNSTDVQQWNQWSDWVRQTLQGFAFISMLYNTIILFDFWIKVG